MGLWGSIKGIGKGVWNKVLDPLLPDEYVGAVGSALGGNWGGAWDKAKTGFKDSLRGAAVGLGGAGLMGAGPLAGALGGVGSAAGGAIKGVGSAALGAGKSLGKQALGSKLGGAAGLGGLAMGGLNAFMNAKDATRYRGIEDEQIDYAKGQRTRQQEMEDKILGNINPALNVPDLGNIFEDTSNPFYKPSAAPQKVGLGSTGGGIPGITGNTNIGGSYGDEPWNDPSIRAQLDALKPGESKQYGNWGAAKGTPGSASAFGGGPGGGLGARDSGGLGMGGPGVPPGGMGGGGGFQQDELLRRRGVTPLDTRV